MNARAANHSLLLGFAVSENSLPHGICMQYYILTWITLTQHFWNKQVSELTVSSVFSYLPVTDAVPSLH